MERISELAPEKTEEKEPDRSLTRYEMSLAEFPLFLLSKHLLR